MEAISESGTAEINALIQRLHVFQSRLDDEEKERVAAAAVTSLKTVKRYMSGAEGCVGYLPRGYKILTAAQSVYEKQQAHLKAA